MRPSSWRLDVRTDFMDQLDHMLASSWAPEDLKQRLVRDKTALQEAGSGQDLVERLGGGMGTTPANGNCQFYSIIECLAGMPARALTDVSYAASQSAACHRARLGS